MMMMMLMMMVILLGHYLVDFSIVTLALNLNLNPTR